MTEFFESYDEFERLNKLYVNVFIRDINIILIDNMNRYGNKNANKKDNDTENEMETPPKKRIKICNNNKNAKHNNALLEPKIHDPLLSPNKIMKIKEKRVTRTLIGLLNDHDKRPKIKSKNKDINKNKQDNKRLIFNNKIVYFGENGYRNKKWSDLSTIRTKILKNIIIKNGGNIVDDPKESNVIICSKNIDKKNFDFIFKTEFKDIWNKITFVNPDWITESIKNKKCISAKLFKIKINHEIKPVNCILQKRKNSEDVSPPFKKMKIQKISDQIVFNDTKMDDSKARNNNSNDKNGKISWVDRNKHHFACQIANSGQNINHNANITKIFDKMEHIYSCLGDKWREYAYKKANGIIKKFGQKITLKNIEELTKRKGFSKKLGSKVKEIIQTGKLKKLSELSQKPTIKTLELFTGIWGVGHATAMKWYNIGHRTLDDIRNNVELNHRQKMGLKYYHDLLVKIPRNEVKEIETLVFSEIQKLCPGAVCVTW